MINIFTDKYYELAMVLVELDPDGPDFEDEDKVRSLLEEKFAIYDYDGFIVLVDKFKLAVDASIYPFNNYRPQRIVKKKKKPKPRKKSRSYPFVQRGVN